MTMNGHTVGLRAAGHRPGHNRNVRLRPGKYQATGQSPISRAQHRLFPKLCPLDRCDQHERFMEHIVDSGLSVQATVFQFSVIKNRLRWENSRDLQVLA
jgi:hypothetical protein